jgi:hypothetical protein
VPFVPGTLSFFQYFAGAEHFPREVTTLADNVRTCPRAEGVDMIQLPGDRNAVSAAGDGSLAFIWTPAPGPSS